MEIGEKIKQRRKELGLSLRELAEKVELTASFLSQVERDQTSPSIDSLRKISQALDVPVFFFLLEQDGPSPVVRRNQRRQINLPEVNVTYQLLTPNLNRKMELVLAELDSQNGEVPLVRHQHTEECIFVLDGELEVTLGNEVYSLQAGDAIYFDGPMLRRLRATGTGRVRYLSVITPPIF
jgi:transcriptional regulator with XRE-family HTH domain